jgi:hypothetical protein
VEGLSFEVRAKGRRMDLECDTVICTGRFRPDASLIYGTPIEEDHGSLGPSVDTNYVTSVDGIYAAGNVLRGADMHDICALEGRYAARSIIRRSRNGDTGNERYLTIMAEDPIRYVVPQKIPGGRDCKGKNSLRPGLSIQTSRNVDKVRMGAWYKQERIWSKKFRRIIANTRVPLALEEFDLSRTEAGERIILKLCEP